MLHGVLLVSRSEIPVNHLRLVSDQLKMQVESVVGPKEALSRLRDRGFSVVVVDETLVEFNASAADAIWLRSMFAVPLEINFALAGPERIVREVRAALRRRKRENLAAMNDAIEQISYELKEDITAIVLNL